MANVEDIKGWVQQLVDANTLVNLTIGEQIQSCDEMIQLGTFFEGAANEHIRTALAGIPVLKQKLEEARAVSDAIEQSALNYVNGL